MEQNILIWAMVDKPEFYLNESAFDRVTSSKLQK